LQQQQQQQQKKKELSNSQEDENIITNHCFSRYSGPDLVFSRLHTIQFVATEIFVNKPQPTKHNFPEPF